jgi:hypothetical protein
MYIYSVTVHIDKDAESDWLDFMQQKHIFDVLKTGSFTKACMRKVVQHTDADKSVYNMEYYCTDKESYESYATKAASALQKDVADRFAGRFKAERMLLEEVFQI